MRPLSSFQKQAMPLFNCHGRHKQHGSNSTTSRIKCDLSSIFSKVWSISYNRIFSKHWIKKLPSSYIVSDIGVFSTIDKIALRISATILPKTRTLMFYCHLLRPLWCGGFHWLGALEKHFLWLYIWNKLSEHNRWEKDGLPKKSGQCVPDCFSAEKNRNATFEFEWIIEVSNEN